uniref:Uncharacterized protein n=1 Tax=Trypanosoma vivax (strain Y486) TaxID=1055687 RepID=G0U3D5_TRYVY|nr:hypothetical protein TVY486_0906120 [Trypanosoma vivax Y486]
MWTVHNYLRLAIILIACLCEVPLPWVHKKESLPLCSPFQGCLAFPFIYQALFSFFYLFFVVRWDTKQQVNISKKPAAAHPSGQCHFLDTVKCTKRSRPLMVPNTYSLTHLFRGIIKVREQPTNNLRSCCSRSCG